MRTIAAGQILAHLLAALAAGAVIGAERTFHGRPAGFRTHALVSMASSALMLITVYQSVWFSASETVRIDPTRMAQGIMTGIGFLGAGVIFKEGLTVRGLTTAASIWSTAAIGILMGTGLYTAGALAAALTLGILSLFRRLEVLLPTNAYAELTVRFGRDSGVTEDDVRKLVMSNGFRVIRVTYHLDGAQVMEYRVAIRSLRPAHFSALAQMLRDLPTCCGFTVEPAGD